MTMVERPANALLLSKPGLSAFATEGLVIRSSEIRDVDTMSAQIDDGIVGEYVQLEARPFRARWTVCHLPTFVVQFSREDVASVHRIRTPSSKWVFVIPLSVPEGVRWDGHAVTNDVQVVCPPGSESFVFDPGGTQFAVISVSPDAAPNLAETAAIKLEEPTASHVVRPFLRDGSVLAQQLRELRRLVEFRSDTISCALLDRVDGEILRALCRCLRGSKASDVKREALRSRSHIFRRAEEFFRDHVGETVSIAQLSSVTGVSERSLRNAFYHVCTTSPKKYLRIWQLHQVRRSLREAPEGPAAVTTAATQHGFFELGRFAGEYRALFGEAPSETLHNARTMPELLPARIPAAAAGR